MMGKKNKIKKLIRCVQDLHDAWFTGKVAVKSLRGRVYGKRSRAAVSRNGTGIDLDFGLCF